MRRPLAPLAMVAMVTVAGCGSASGGGDGPPLACTDSEAAVVRALAAAPGPVTLSDGTRLSDCVARATSDADLQGVGIVLTGAAERLVDAGNAVAVGYLVGAARRGAEHTGGVQIELVRRLESAGRRATDEAALLRGERAGARGG
jgi:hypothetical protein